MSAVAAALLLSVGSGGAAYAAEPEPGSSQGGKPGPSVPSGYKLTTELPKTISVDNDSDATSLTAKVTNNGSAATDAIRLSVVGFKGLTVKNVEGCAQIPKEKLPKGSNSGFACAIDKLESGKSRSYKVTASFDLKQEGQICLPVTLGDTETLLWQQGPVDFGTSKPIPDAPDTPLLLGVKNATAAGGASPSPSPTTPSTPAPPADPSGPDAPGKDGQNPPQDKLPDTGPPDVLPMAGVAAALLLAGGGGLWLTRGPSRRAERR